MNITMLFLNTWSNNNFRCFSCSVRSFEVNMEKIILLRNKVKFKCNSARRRCNNVVTDVLPFLILWRITDHD